MKKGFEDVLIEPQRASLIPGFYDVKNAAIIAGALGCSISGAGPSVFALTENLEIANTVKLAMVEAFQKHAALKSSAWISLISPIGARVI